MATHSRILAWEIPWTEEPGELQSMGVARIRRNLVTKQQFLRKWWKVCSSCKYFQPQTKEN